MPDAKAVIVVARDSEDEPDRLFWLSLESRERRPLTSPPSGIAGDTAIAVSPDGRALVFSRVIAYGNADLYLLRLSPDGRPLGEQPRRLTSEAGMEMDPAWTSDGRSIIYAAGPVSSNTRLWKLDAWAGNKPLEFGAADINARRVALDPRGGRMAYMVKRDSANIWSLDLTDHRTHAPQRLIASNSINQMPDYSFDGNSIAFESTRTGAREIWVRRRDGFNMTQLTRFQADTGAPRWSPDGKRMAFFSNFQGNREIYVINAESRDWVRITDDPADDADPAWSRDGKWIYFTSDRAGHRATWKSPSGGGKPRPVIHGGEFATGESPDGKSLYYARRVGASPALWSASLNGGSETKILDSFVQRNSAVGREGVYFIPASERYSIFYRDFATGKTRELLAMTSDPAWGLAVSPDERTLLFSQEGEVTADLVLLEGVR